MSQGVAYPPELHERAFALAVDGATVNTISAEIGVPARTIDGWMARAGVKVRRRRDHHVAHPVPHGPWIDRAACVDSDPEIFHSTHPGDIADALDTCRACPVRADCLAWAIETGDTHAVLGGTTAGERGRG